MSPPFDSAIAKGPLRQAIWTIAWPTMVQNLIAGLQGVVDHAMVGHYVGFEANAAIGVSWQIFLVVVVFVSSVFSGMGVLVARFAGAGDRERVNRVVYQAFLTATMLSLFVFAPIGYLCAPWLLDLVHASPAVRAEALPYLTTMFVFSLGMLQFFMFGGALRAAGDARTPLRLGILMTVCNLVLNVVLIRGLGPIPAFGTRGAAMGTVIAAGLTTVYALHLLLSNRLVISFQKGMSLRPDRHIIASLFRFGLPTGFQGIVMNLGGVALIRFVGSLPSSAEAQAAYAVGYTQLFSFITWTSTALLAATATVAGQSLGNGDPERAAAAPRTASIFGLAIALPMASLFVLVPHRLLSVFGMEGETVLSLGSELLAYLAVSAVLLTTALCYTGALQGTGDTRSPMYISLVSQLVLPLSLCAILDFTRGLQASDIWLAIVLGHALRCALSVYRFQAGGWRDIDVSIDSPVIASSTDS